MEHKHEKINVLVACEFSGVVRDAFISEGHNAISVDLLPTTSPGPHLMADMAKILEAINEKSFDLMIAHPPCTRLCNSGVVWLHKRNLWKDMVEGALFFKSLLEANIPHVAIENPVMHKYAVEIIGRRQNFSCHPWHFGDKKKKRTCWWTKELPPLIPDKDASPEGAIQYSYLMSPSPDRGLKRSITPKSMAKAMAVQWGNYVVKSKSQSLS